MNKILTVLLILSALLFMGANFNSIDTAAYPYRFEGGTVGNCVALTNANQTYTFSTAYNVFYEICAHGNEAYILHGAAPVATTVVGAGYDSRIPEGGCTKIYKPNGAKVAFIAVSTAAGAAICIKPYTIP